MNSMIASVIVTYNPELNNLTNLVNELLSQDCYVIIVDNSNGYKIPADFFKDSNSLVIHRYNENKGIAAAQNTGIKIALQSSASKIIFFDQDSKIYQGFIKRLSEQMNNKDAQVGGPVFVDRDKGHYYPICHIEKSGIRRKIKIDEHTSPFETSVTISSGTMVNADVFNVVGLMDEDLFIDYVDTEWCLRCYNKGIAVSIFPDIKMVHAIGDNSVKIAGINVPVHSAARRYYRVRNGFLMLRNKDVPLLLSIREITFSFIHTLIILMSQKNKTNYIKFYCHGVIDGIKGVTGVYQRNA